MKKTIGSLVALFVVSCPCSLAGELERIERKIPRQPDFNSKAPGYCLLVFGPDADTRVWLSMDLAYDPLREKPGKTEFLYADRNGNGDLTDPGERIPVNVVTKEDNTDFGFGGVKPVKREMHLPQFRVGDVTSRDGKTVYRNLVVDVDWYIFGRKDRKATVSVDVPGKGRQSVGGNILWFARDLKEAPVVWFDGRLTLRTAPSGLLHLPVDYTGKEPPLPYYEQFPLVRGQKMPLRVQVGSAGIGLGTFNTVPCETPPEDVHPVARVVFPHSDPTKPAIEVTVSLNERCCGTLFNGSIEVPKEVALGKAEVRLSFLDWHAGKVIPSVETIEVSDKDTRPKVFR